MSVEEDLPDIQLQNSIDNNQTICIGANDEHGKHDTLPVDETDEYVVDFMQNDNAILDVKLDASMEQIYTEIAKEPFPDIQQNLVDQNNELAGNNMIQDQIPQQIDNNANLGEQIEQIPTNVNFHGNNELQEHNISPKPKPKRKRATKAQMKDMTPEEKIKRRKESNKISQRNCTQRKRDESVALENKSVENFKTLESLEQSCKNKIDNIYGTFHFMQNYQPKSDKQQYFNTANIIALLNLVQVIQMEYSEYNRNIDNIDVTQQLKDQVKKMAEILEIAEKNRRLRQGNVNTLGSRKHRANFTLKNSKLQLDCWKTMFKIDIYKFFEEKIDEIKFYCLLEFKDYMNAKDIRIREKMQMKTEDLDNFDKILSFFELPNPS